MNLIESLMLSFVFFTIAEIGYIITKGCLHSWSDWIDLDTTNKLSGLYQERNCKKCNRKEIRKVI